jgi:hypothetical protein
MFVTLRWSMASCGDIGGKGIPLFGGRPGLELRSDNKLFFIRIIGFKLLLNSFILLLG